MNRIRMYLSKIIVIILSALILAGCWDNQELDTISIVTGIGIDLGQNKENIKLTLELGNTSQSKSNSSSGAAGSNDDSPLILETEDRSILTAINRLQRQTTRSLFLHHNQVVIFGRAQAEKGIKQYMDVFLRRHDMRMETLVFIAEGSAQGILSTNMKQDKISSLGIIKMIEGADRQYRSYSVRVLDLVSMIIDETTFPIIPMLKLEDNDGEKRIALAGLGVLNSDEKLIYELNETEIKGYTWIANKYKDAYLELEVEHGFSNLNILNIEHKIEPKIGKDNALTMNLDIVGDVSVAEVQGFNNMPDEKIIELLIDQGKKKIDEEIQICLNKSQELQADFLRFGAAFYKKYPKEWEEMKVDWENIYPTIQLITNIELNLIDTGKIVNPISMKE